jgi:hypothetical protein
MSSSYGTTGTPGTTGMGQSVTGIPNQLFDLVSVLYHTLKSGTTYQTYIQDAQQSGDKDLMQFFQQLQQQDKQRAQQAQQLLNQKMQMTAH